jgi:hypothetical protein
LYEDTIESIKLACGEYVKNDSYCPKAISGNDAKTILTFVLSSLHYMTFLKKKKRRTRLDRSLSAVRKEGSDILTPKMTSKIDALYKQEHKLPP